MIELAIFGVGLLVTGMVTLALFQIGRIESRLVAERRAENNGQPLHGSAKHMSKAHAETPASVGRPGLAPAT